MENLNELKQTAEQLQIKLSEFQEKSKTVDINSPEGVEFALAWSKTINQYLETDESI